MGLEELAKLSKSDFESNAKLRKSLRKCLKTNGFDIIAVESAAVTSDVSTDRSQDGSRINADDSSAITVTSDDEHTEVRVLEDDYSKHIFLAVDTDRPESESESVGRGRGATGGGGIETKEVNEQEVYNSRKEKGEVDLIVRIPISEVAGDFRCYPGDVVVTTSSAASPTSVAIAALSAASVVPAASLSVRENHPYSDSGDMLKSSALVNGKHCETRVRVVEYGTFQGRPVTKVLLTPLTGRRHQLRVHMCCLGHPIVGDYTYNSRERDNNTEGGGGGEGEGEGEGERRGSCAPRMMLHAYKLRIPDVDPNILKRLLKRKRNTCEDVAIDKSVAVSAAVASFVNVGNGTQRRSSPAAITSNTALGTDTHDNEPALKYLIDVETTDPFPMVNGQLQLSIEA